MGLLHGTHLDFSSSLPFGPLSLVVTEKPTTWQRNASVHPDMTTSVSKAFSSVQSHAAHCSPLDFTLILVDNPCLVKMLDWIGRNGCCEDFAESDN